MKRVLITGKNSYIGTSLENWLMREPDNYKVDTIDMKDGSWKEKDFGSYDVVFQRQFAISLRLLSAVYHHS